MVSVFVLCACISSIYRQPTLCSSDAYCIDTILNALNPTNGICSSLLLWIEQKSDTRPNKLQTESEEGEKQTFFDRHIPKNRTHVPF